MAQAGIEILTEMFVGLLGAARFRSDIGGTAPAGSSKAVLCHCRRKQGARTPPSYKPARTFFLNLTVSQCLHPNVPLQVPGLLHRQLPA